MIQYLITALIDFGLGCLALTKKENSAAKALAVLLFSLSCWLIELYLLTTLNNINVLNVLFHITRGGMFFIPFGFALLTWRLLGSRSLWFKRLFIISGGVFSTLLWLGNMFIFPSKLEAAAGGYLPKLDSIYYVFIGYLLWCFLGSIGFVLYSYRASSSREKQRLKWLLITLLVSLSCGLLVLIAMPSGFYLSKLVGVITNIVFVSLLFYSTIQHNLMDVRLALSLGLTKSLLLGFFISLYFMVTSVVGDHTESIGGALTLLVFLVLILEAYPRILRWILPNAKKILAKRSYEFRNVREDTKKALSDTLNFPMIQAVLDHLLLKIIRLDNYEILIVKDTPKESCTRQPQLQTIQHDDPLISYCNQMYKGTEQTQLLMADEAPLLVAKQLEKNQASMYFPIKINNKIFALALIGAPTDQTYYRYDDIKIFEWLQTELGLVLNRLIHLDTMQDQLIEAKKTLSMLSLMNHYHHDIKAPFAIIDGVLSNNIYDKDKQKAIVLAQVERGSRLIATMSGILGGKHQRKIQPCALEDLIKDCIFLFEASIDNVIYDLSQTPKIQGDSEDLKILFINIIKNSVEARRKNEDLVLHVKSWMNEGNTYFSIADNGAGMNSDQLNSLWEAGLSTKPLGNGIGMQAIKRIADEHNAKIEAKSVVGEGTELVLLFSSEQLSNHAHNIGTAKDELAERRASYKGEKTNIQ